MAGLGPQLFPSLEDSAGPLRVSGFRLRQPQCWARCFHVNPPGKPTDPEHTTNPPLDNRGVCGREIDLLRSPP